MSKKVKSDSELPTDVAKSGDEHKCSSGQEKKAPQGEDHHDLLETSWQKDEERPNPLGVGLELLFKPKLRKYQLDMAINEARARELMSLHGKSLEDTLLFRSLYDPVYAFARQIRQFDQHVYTGRKFAVFYLRKLPLANAEVICKF